MNGNFPPEELQRWDRDGLAIIDLPLPLPEGLRKYMVGNVVAYRMQKTGQGISYDRVLAIAKDTGFTADMTLRELIAKRFPELTSRDYVCSHIPPEGSTFIAAFSSR